jgi:hypothetical protein
VFGALQTITKGTNITQSVGSASNLQGDNVNINAQDITNTASNITWTSFAWL